MTKVSTSLDHVNSLYPKTSYLWPVRTSMCEIWEYQLSNEMFLALPFVSKVKFIFHLLNDSLYFISLFYHQIIAWHNFFIPKKNLSS